MHLHATILSKSWKAGIASAVMILSAVTGVSAQTGSDPYPERPIRIISPAAAGGTTDILARLVGKELFPQSTQVVVVENVPGAGGTIGLAQVARSPSDGYTLELGGVSMHAMSGSLYSRLPFDPIEDFEPVSMLADVTMAIGVPASAPFADVAELIAYAKANPGKLAYGSGGVGSINHLALAVFAKAAGIDMLHVPYKGGGPAVNATLQGEVQLVAAGTSLLVPHAKSGKLRLLAVMGDKRARVLPTVPAVAETIPGFKMANWYGILAPKGLPSALRQKLWAEFDRVMRLPEMSDKLDNMGLEYPGLTVEQFNTALRADHQYWRTLIPELGIQPH